MLFLPFLTVPLQDGRFFRKFSFCILYIILDIAYLIIEIQMEI
ncbi:hypothetical protein L905_21270 [Agrobacterium sp. TS43]|nr:hypothetical protein L906_24625 [Agrobacterium sp. TS45]KVK62108.1 hypothetical protein L905_21270 [Agrobacterium sp. TS43]KVK63729.1 hypothetical protein L907_24585 [Agrobacterium sp. C13]